MKQRMLVVAMLGMSASLALAQMQNPSQADVQPPATQQDNPLPPLMVTPAPPATAVPPSPGAGADSVDASSARPPAGPVARLEPKTVGGVTYLCGGVGKEEVNYMKKTASEHDLMLTFATSGGNFLADVNVQIDNAKGDNVLTVRCNGPIMLVDLPESGTYRIHAEADGYERNSTAHVNTATRAPTALVMSAWPQALARGMVQPAVSTGSSAGVAAPGRSVSSDPGTSTGGNASPGRGTSREHAEALRRADALEEKVMQNLSNASLGVSAEGSADAAQSSGQGRSAVEAAGGQ